MAVRKKSKLLHPIQRDRTLAVSAVMEEKAQVPF